MTSLSLSAKSSWKDRIWYYIAVVPFYAIRNYLAIFLITTGTLYASAMFNMQHEIFPPEIAFPLAIGIEWTYLSGLAYATELRSNRWSLPMIVAGAVISGLFGILYILGHYDVIPKSPEPIIAFALSLAHIIPLVILLVLYTLCKRDFAVERRDDEEKIIAEKSRKSERIERWRDEKLLTDIRLQKIEAEKAELEIEDRKIQQEERHLKNQERKLRCKAAPSGESTIVPTSLPTTEVRVWTCRRCGSQQKTTGSPRHKESISVRHGCESCKQTPKS